MVGMLTGFFGVGGGFVIVPVFALWPGLGLRCAVATSLVVITLTALAALGSHALVGSALDVPVTALLASSAGAGAIAGTAIGRCLPHVALARGFSLAVSAVAVLLLIDVLALNGPPGA